VISPKLANLVIVIVTCVWVVSFGVSLISATYKPDPQINVIFMAIVGGAMALKAKRDIDSGKSKDSPK
jgi:hypothetical protein